MKKAQMAMFLMIGFVLLITVIFIMSAVFNAQREEQQERADQVAEALLDSTSVRTYIDGCVSDSADKALKELAFHGGYFPNITRPGHDKNLNENIQFMNYTDDGELHQAAYLLRKSDYDIDPVYPCPLFGDDCGGPGVDGITGSEDPGRHYCGFSFDNSSQLETCNYGHREPITLSFGNNSIRRQLQYKVSDEVSECIDASFFSEQFELESENISDADIITRVSFGTTSVSFSVDVPLVVSVSDAQSISTSSHSHKIDVNFPRMFNELIFGPGSAVYEDWDNIDVNIEEFADKIIILNRLDYEVEHRLNQDFKDDLFIISHEDYTIDGDPFEFRFAIGNRRPVLSEINYAKENDFCEVHVPPGTNVTIDAEYADPDHHDNPEVKFDEKSSGFIENYDDEYEAIDASGWDSENGVVYKNMTDLDEDYVELLDIIVDDGEYKDSQNVRICVDRNADLNYEPKVEPYYDYSGFDDKYELDGEEIQRITREDPIILKTGSGFSGKGTWAIGQNPNVASTECVKEDVSSSCLVYPGWDDCDDGFTGDIETIDDEMKGCLGEGSESVYFLPSGYDSDGNIKIPLRVEQCFPHENDGSAGENSFLQSNVCCNSDFEYQGSSHAAQERKQLFCGDPEQLDNVRADSANDFYSKITSASCFDDRGNYFNDDDDTSISSELHKENPDTDVTEGQRCKGCGTFGEPVDDNITVRYDYEDRDSKMSTFESAFKSTLDGSDEEDISYLCDPNVACVGSFSGSGRGKYDPSNYITIDEEEREVGILACQGACDNGECDYAVNCECTSECGVDVPEICDGKSVGEETGTCTLDPFGEDYYPDLCGTQCEPKDIDDNRYFRCDDPDSDSDCTHCDVQCDGKSEGDILESCDYGENSAVRDQCNYQGRVVDLEESGGEKRCVYDESMSCTSSPECDGTIIGDFATDDSGDVIVDAGSYIYLAAECSDSCSLVDSNTCWEDSSNSVHGDCHQRERGEGFHRLGSSTTKDSFCTSTCGAEMCEDNFAYKGGDECINDPNQENCCYDVEDLDDNHDEICNLRNPDTDYEGCRSE